MKGKKVTKVLSLILTLLLFMHMFSFASSADTLPEMEIDISCVDEGGYELLFCITQPYETESIDFTLNLPEGVTVNSFTTENTDADDIILSEDDSPDKNSFICDHNYSEDTLRFSGCFANAYQGEERFSFFRVGLTITEQSDKYFLSLRYSFQTKNTSKSTLCTYDLTLMTKATDESYPTFFVGDIDGDGRVTASDARLALRYCVGLEDISPDRLSYANCDGNDTISAADARLILRTSVGISQPSERAYKISIPDDEDCQSAGQYIYECVLTGETFTLVAAEHNHVYTAASCTEDAKCLICNAVIASAEGHTFTDEGYCTRCNAYEDEITEVKNSLDPIFTEINKYDRIATEAAAKNDISGYIKNTQKAALKIKDAMEICEGINGMTQVYDYLSEAYSLIFDAFIDAMDENGMISSNRRAYNIIYAAVAKANAYLEYAQDALE